ncbi:MAG: DNA-binding domain-containing protein [Chloroflexota bacterium]
MAMVQPIGAADLDAIIERMIQQGSTVTKADTVSVLEDYFTTIENMLLEGMNVNTPMANLEPALRGV